MLSILTLSVILLPSVIPAFAFSNGQAAIIELGQPPDADPFDSGDVNNHGISERSLNYPYDLTFDPAGNLWVADSVNHRILMYPKNEFEINGGNATVVIGQNDFNTNIPGLIRLGTIAAGTQVSGTSASTLAGPMGVAFDLTGNLWVADTEQGRILMFPKTGTTISHTATTVLGQPDFTTSPSSTSAHMLDQPKSITFDQSGNLWISDMGYSDIVMFPKTGTTFSNNVVKIIESASTISITASNVNAPQDVAFDSTGNLWVADEGNNRILMFPKTGTTISHTATTVLGQSDFITGTSSNITASTFDKPIGITFDSTGNLWVADEGNNRILMFPKTGTTISHTATTVLGQSVFTTNTFGASASTLTEPSAIAFDCTGNLWVADQDNNRILMYATDTPVHCLENQHLPSSSQNPNMVEFDRCVINGHLVCKIHFDVFREIISCYDQVDGPLCPLPKTMTQDTRLEIQQEFPPLKQVQAGIPLKDIVAAKGNVLIMNDHRSSPASVTENTANSLLSNPFWHKFP